MKGWLLVLVWFACVIIGAAIGVGIGYLLWKMGFPLIGSAVMLVGAGWVASWRSLPSCGGANNVNTGSSGRRITIPAGNANRIVYTA